MPLFLPSALLFSMEQQHDIQLKKIPETKNSTINQRPLSWPNIPLDGFEKVNEKLEAQNAFNIQTRKLAEEKIQQLEEKNKENHREIEQLVALASMQQSQIAKLIAKYSNYKNISNEKPNRKKKGQRSKSEIGSKKVKKEKSSKSLSPDDNSDNPETLVTKFRKMTKNKKHQISPGVTIDPEPPVSSGIPPAQADKKNPEVFGDRLLQLQLTMAMASVNSINKDK